jgi:hypothetical protein
VATFSSRFPKHSSKEIGLKFLASVCLRNHADYCLLPLKWVVPGPKAGCKELDYVVSVGFQAHFKTVHVWSDCPVADLELAFPIVVTLHRNKQYCAHRPL